MDSSDIVSEAEEILFSPLTISGYYLSGIVYFLLPVAAFLVMRRYGAARLYPVITGAIVYFLSTRLCDMSVTLLLASAPYERKAAAAVELMGFFEEPARWLAMKYPITDIKKPNAAICYGIGHGGLECWIRGVQKFQVAGYGQKLRNEGIEAFISGKSAEKASEITERLRSFADNGFFMSLLDSVHSAAAFGVHIALSLLIFRKVIKGDMQKRWLVLAIVLHVGLNETAGIAQFLGGALTSDIAGIIFCVFIIVLVYKKTDGRQVIDDIVCPIERI